MTCAKINYCRGRKERRNSSIPTRTFILTGGECNPFAVVRCGMESERTAVASGTRAPEWRGGQMIFCDVAEAGLDHVVVDVLHKSPSAATDEPLGRAAVDLCVPV